MISEVGSSLVFGQLHPLLVVSAYQCWDNKLIVKRQFGTLFNAGKEPENDCRDCQYREDDSDYHNVCAKT